MSIQHMARVWREGPEDSSERLLLLALADHADQQTGQCYPSIERLVTYTKLSRATIFRLLNQLSRPGSRFLRLVAKGGQGARNTNTYEVFPGAPEESPTATLKGGTQRPLEESPTTTLKGRSQCNKGRSQCKEGSPTATRSVIEPSVQNRQVGVPGAGSDKGLTVRPFPTHPPTTRSSWDLAPDLGTVLAYFRKSQAKAPKPYTVEEITAVWHSFQATSCEGRWFFGKRPVGDWRSAVEARLASERSRQSAERKAPLAMAERQRIIQLRDLVAKHPGRPGEPCALDFRADYNELLKELKELEARK